MKNFFKKLAFVLSLAMVLTTFAPAAKASAATAPSLKATGKVLYLGGDQSEQYGETYTFKFQNSKGYTAEWKANNPSIATMSEEKNTVVAVAPGTATFDVTLTNKAGKAVNLTATVWVRQNADSVGFGSKKAIETAKVVGDTFKINVYRGLDGKKVWSQTDYSTITDKVVWESSDESVATVNKWGTVTCKAAGECTITAKAVQNQGNLTSAKASYTFTVNAGITSAKLVSSTQAVLTFGAAITQDVANTITMTNSKGVNISTYIKKAELDSTGTKVTVDTYVAFADKETYTFAVESLKTSFDMPVSIGVAAAVKLTAPTAAVIDTATEIKFDVLDANGIVIGKADTATQEFTLSDYTYSYLDTANNKITMYKKGETTTLTLKYHTGTYDANWNEIVFTDSMVITCTDAASKVANNLTYFVATTDSDDNAKAAVKTVALESAGYFLRVRAKDADNNTIKNEAGFKFESLDPTKLFVNQDTGFLVPVSVGSVPVRITLGDNFATVVTVTVGPKAVATTPSVETSGTTTLSNAATVDEQVTFKVIVKDQYQQNMTAETLDRTVMACPKGADAEAVSHLDLTEAGKATFKAAGITTPGTYTYKLSMYDKPVYVSVIVKAPAVTNVASAAAYKVIVNNGTLDTIVKSDSKKADYETAIKVVAVDANGVAIGIADAAKITVKSGDKIIYSDAEATTSDDAVAKDAVKKVEGGKYTFSALAGTGSVTVTGLTSVAKVKSATYTVTGTIEANGKTRNISPANVIVKDTQIAPTVTDTGVTLSVPVGTSLDSIKADVLALLKAPDDNTTSQYTGLALHDVDTVYTAVSGKGTYHLVIKTVDLTETMSGNALTHTITLNKIITITVTD